MQNATIQWDKLEKKCFSMHRGGWQEGDEEDMEQKIAEYVKIADEMVAKANLPDAKLLKSGNESTMASNKSLIPWLVGIPIVFLAGFFIGHYVTFVGNANTAQFPLSTIDNNWHSYAGK